MFKLVHMSGNNVKGIIIPSVMVGENTGRELKDYYTDKNG